MKRYFLTVKGTDYGYAADEVLRWLDEHEPHRFSLEGKVVGSEVRLTLEVPGEEAPSVEHALSNWYQSDLNITPPYPAGSLLWWGGFVPRSWVR